MSTLPQDSAGSESQEPNQTSPREAAVKIAEEVADKVGEEIFDESGSNSPIEATDEASVLQKLTEGVRDQDDLERDISFQANKALIKQEDERDKKRMSKVNTARAKVVAQKEKLQQHLRHGSTAALRDEIATLDQELASHDEEIKGIQKRIDDRHKYDEEVANQDQSQAGRSLRMPNESQRDFLIRTGKITPFSRLPGREASGLSGDLKEVLLDAGEEAESQQILAEEIGSSQQCYEQAGSPDKGPTSHVNLKRPGFAEADEVDSHSLMQEDFGLRPRKRLRDQQSRVLSTALISSEEEDIDTSRQQSTDIGSPQAFTPGSTESDLLQDIDESEEGVIISEGSLKRKKTHASKTGKLEDLSGIDDGNEKHYQERLKDWIERRSNARNKKQNEQRTLDDADGPVETEAKDGVDEWLKPSPDAPDYDINNGLKIPGDVHPALFDYQKTGVKWLGELYDQQVGGIVGDEMGLGKTIQIISFLASLHHSNQLNKPVIIVAPATVLKQWVNEFHLWWPPMRVSILHSSGSGMLNVGREDDDDFGYYRNEKKSKSSKAAKRIVDKVVQHGHVLVTTYAGLQTYSDVLIPVNWGYAVLDEGHKIRNPNTEVTIYCKQLRTPNRIILSGTPIQNNLVELWSLFDFVYPMRLGNLVNFRQQFEIPIKQGGYANATNLQIMTATQCAETLKDAISPYLLQRLKVDVAADLPKKTEQVLFCKLTKPQRDAYVLYLGSRDMQAILNRDRLSFSGIDTLRKICNHPDLLDPILKKKPGYKWGNPNKSGKMQVVKALLEIWKKAGDKILLFSQGVQMLNILESFVKDLGGINYLRMDGTTNIKDRQALVDRFNNDPEIDLFLLTTKVGGLGVNLTGGNRVIIFDPDWNPSTDVQARERAWRLGQRREVTIYRLMSAGTIEEKMYHRQIFKQFLTDKVLKDPKQRQIFHQKDLHDLFTLGESDEKDTETSRMFEGSEVKLSTDSGSGKAKSKSPEVEDEKQLRDITGVAGLEEYQNDEGAKENTDNDARIMEGIFARSGVHSVLQHDQIINSNGKRVITADRGMVEREARRVAAEAAAELRRAQQEAQHVPIGTVTWTGEVGEAGRPENLRRRAGPSSASILNGLSARQGVQSGSSGRNSGSSSRSGTPGSAIEAGSNLRAKDYLKMIPEYITRQGGAVPSQMLVVHFQHMVRTPQQTAEFKAALDEVAELKPPMNNRMRGRWELREEYRGTR